MSFLAFFMGKPLHVHNPYLRAKMVDVLHHWVPPPNISHPRVTKMQNLFEFHEMGKQVLVRHLLRLYVDIEFTGSHTQVSALLQPPLSPLFTPLSPLLCPSLSLSLVSCFSS